MKKILKENWAYYLSYFLLFGLGIAVFFNISKGDEIIYFAKERNIYLDNTFVQITKIGEAYIYIVAIGILLYKSMRYAFAIPLIGLTTLLVSLSLKAFFATPRPWTFFYREFGSGALTGIPDYTLHVGYNSFPSGHSMSALAIFTFISLCISNKKLATLLIIPAVLVAFSRIVISQHFLEDILAGSLVGLVLGTLIFYLQTFIPFKETAWYDRPFGHKEFLAKMGKGKREE